MDAVGQTFRRFQLVAPLNLQVDDGNFSKLELVRAPDETRLTLPGLNVGQVILVTGDERLAARLITRYRSLGVGWR